MNNESMVIENELEKIVLANKTDPRPMKQVVFFEGEDPETKLYLVLLYMYDQDMDDIQKEWKIMTGRQDTYDYLKELVSNETIDPNKSFILPGDRETIDANGELKEDISFSDGVRPITVLRFLKVMYNGNKVLDADAMFLFDDYDPINYGSGDNTIIEVE